MSRINPVWLSLYAGMSTSLRPAVSLLLSRRQKAGKEDPHRISERRGIAGMERPEGPLFWLHAASVGELVSILPIVDAIRAKNIHVLVTTGTLTSAAVAAKRLPAGAIHQFVPLDIPTYVRRFYRHWQPDMAIFAESEIWPNLMHTALKRRIPLGIVNGDMSERSFRRWQKLRGFIGPLLSRLDFCLTQSEMDAERFQVLGAVGAKNIGNLKFDAAVLPFDKEALLKVTAITSRRPVWLAASTHEGEDEIVLAAHMDVAQKHRQLLTIIVPRHPHRGEAIADLARAKGLNVRLRSKGEEPNILTDVYVADTMGELGLFYRAVPIAFVGASLVAPGGGHNPIEPAQLDTAILHGPQIGNFIETYAAFAESGGTCEVKDGQALAAQLDLWFSKPGEIAKAAEAAARTVASLGGALELTIVQLEPYMLQQSLDLRRSEQETAN